ncbi:TetR/AcrR family transcriptional regulator [Nonomuraea turcica]|uniref:TetR/AcrR family transcriptional regulator n=1 Tax=Nonomuraea sp. G32 TaxID=3067274 RepID=UPI00273BD9E9|nr:TetR/AcrR family transcriptional regulator [Nonomuraea sp. G32]MDP4510091.1 TetR/AcrR family transcriptional regulator [Nonomuraea sp. G32]
MERGRPRSFEADRALEVAMRLFWRDGYEGTSLSDLTEAMGINRRSLYAAFGNKESLFLKAVDRYLQGPGAFVAAALAEPTARSVAERMLYGAADAYTMPGHPRGCLLVQGALACGAGAEPLRRDLAARRASGVAALRVRFERALMEGDLPAGIDPGTLAHYLTAVGQGISVQAAGGVSRVDLHRLADQALAVWPEGAVDER